MKIYALDSTEIVTVQRRLLEDPEVSEAVDHLVFSLGHSKTEKEESTSWNAFADRMQFLITRARKQTPPKGRCI